ncbi:MAG TPA: hypothetical protein VNN08_09605 [Thermoanaerobaculia bacterium]|nr:hypothetical protein [Thermoanaerobaculia bacterium]
MLVRRLALTLLFVAAMASAQPAAPTPPDPCETGKTDVCAVTRFQTNRDQKADQASLGDSIVVTMKDSVYAAIVPPSQAGTKKITLYLNGRDSLLTPDIYNDANNQLTFHLERNSDNKDVWTGLLREPYKSPHRSVLVTIGVTGSQPLTSDSSFTLVVVKWAWYAWLWILLLIIVLIAFFWLASKRDILRDGPPVNGNRQPYSLGKSQMAWWFFLIIIGFVMIWLISGDQDTISASLLTLMGISSGTALGSSLIERNAKNPPAPAPDGGAAPPPPPPPAPPVVSRGWLMDILSDSNGSIVLHRLQNVLWTLVLGIMLVVAVVTSLTMPAFNSTLVTLMGISSGTYVGFKFAED